MKRVIARGVGAALLLLLVFWPALTFGGGEAADTRDVVTITDYRGDFDVQENGRVDVVETLRVSYPIDRHGIFRFFDLRDPNDSMVRLEPEDITVTRDGQDEPFEVLREGHGRYRNVKIGSASTTLTGEHVYVIRYTVDGAVAPGKGERSEFYWNLIPGGWQLPIQQSTLTVHLPAGTQDVFCAVGAGATDGCTAEDTADGFVVRTGALEPRTPVTVRAGLDMATPERNTELWPIRFDAVFGPNLFVLVVVLLLAAATAFLGARLAGRSREPKPPYPLMYAPPDGIGPAQGKYLFTERVGREAFVASIMQTAEKGATRLDRGDGWTIADTGQQDAWTKLDPISAYAAEVVGVPGGSFTADKSVAAGKRLKAALSAFDGATKQWARQNGLVTTAGLGSLGGILVILAVVATLWLGFANPFDMSVLALVPGLFALGAVELLAPGASTKRTATGRELWSRIGGFRRMLATPSAEQRFDFSSRKDLYTAYIPWAVAFGVADAWAEKYRVETGEEPPAPGYVGTGYAGGGSLASSMADDFSATVGSAISAYEATQRSSSSSGGGSSGGGGGGGGGGGSW